MERCTKSDILEEMKITIGPGTNTTQVRGCYRTNVTFWDPDGPPHSSANIDVFIPKSNSVTEIKRRALEQARAFLQKALDAPAVETTEIVP